MRQLLRLLVRRPLNWFVDNWTASNNFRLGAFWAAGFIHLMINLAVFGFGPGIGFGHDEEAQRYYNAFFHDRYVTDAELASWLFRGLGDIAALFGWGWGWLRWASWTVWVLMFVFNVLYIPIAFRDEVSRAWRKGVRTVRERRGSPGASATPPTRPPAGGAAGVAQAGAVAGGLREIYVFFREIIGATLANLFTHR